MPTLQQLQTEALAALDAAQAEGVKLGYDAAVADFYGQNAAFLLCNIFADALEGAAGRLASHDQGFATKMHAFAQMLRDSVNQPSVTITTPAPSASGPAVSITVKFSEDMDPTTMIAASFVVQDGSATVPCTVDFNSQSRTVTLTPQQVITVGDTVTVTVSHSVRNTQGVAMEEPYQWSFTATTPPAQTLAPAAASSTKATRAPKKT